VRFTGGSACSKRALLIIFAGLACGLANGSPDGLGEDVPDTGGVLAQDVGVDAQGHGGVGVAESGGLFGGRSCYYARSKSATVVVWPPSPLVISGTTRLKSCDGLRQARKSKS